MTEPPSAEAMKLASRYADGEVKKCAAEIDALIAQRVSAETERWQHRDRQRLEQIERLQETVQSFQSARDEQPAPETVHLTLREQSVMTRALLRSTRPAPPQRLAHTYQIGDCLCGYGWNCKETGCRKPPPRDPKAWSDADA